MESLPRALNKRDLVLDELSKNNIDVCCMQETELDPDINPDIISSGEFVFEVEKNTVKKRVGIFI